VKSKDKIFEEKTEERRATKGAGNGERNTGTSSGLANNSEIQHLRDADRNQRKAKYQ